MNTILHRYLKILEGRENPKFQIAKKCALLDEKIKKAYKTLENCELCERKCHVNRLKNQWGFCKIGNKMVVSSYFDHYGEEEFFVPSFTVFFWSCTFSCQFCQNWTISQRKEQGMKLSEKELAAIIDRHNYCKNFNAVGGDPVPQLPFILKTLSYVKSNIPIVWNSNFYMSTSSMNLLRDVVDVYLSDFKYGNNECAERLSKVKNYFNIAKRNHLLAFKDSEMVIRHLALPNHFECCSKPVLDFIEKHFKDKVIVNIMKQYRPEYRAFQFKEISRKITNQEFQKIIDYAKELNLNFMI